MGRATSKLVCAALAASSCGLFAGCSSSSVCTQLPPSFELDIGSAGGIDVGSVKSLLIELTIGTDRWRKSYDVAMGLGSGTSVVVRIDPAPSGMFMAHISAVAFDGAGGSGRLVATTQDDFTGTPNGCNRFQLNFGKSNPDGGAGEGGVQDAAPDAHADVGPTDGPRQDTGTDGGPHDGAPDGGSDVGPTDGPNDTGTADEGPSDTGPMDMGPEDTGIQDTGSQDALPDTGQMDTGIQDATSPDATPDSGVLNDAGFPYSPSNFDPNGLAAMGGDIMLNCGVSVFDSTTLIPVNWCGGNPAISTVSQPNGPSAVVLAMSSLNVASGSTLRLVGNRPIILAVFGNTTVSGTIDASANINLVPGPGGSLGQFCTPGTGVSALMTAGGGGGGYGGMGGLGGAGGSGEASPSGGPVVPNDRLIPLHGGCAGGDGGGATNHGQGGGAIQISAAAIVNVNGTILAGGGGGGGGPRHSGAGGAGSGGAILIEGTTITLMGDLGAGGGGGGGGGAAGGGGAGQDGTNGGTTLAAGGGGAGGGGTGGNGGGAVGATNGDPGGAPNGGGGGGGGGAGRIRLNAQAACVLMGSISPTPTSNQAPGCP